MGQQHLFDHGGKFAWRIILMILAAVSLTGCGTTLLGGGSDQPPIEIWKHRDQFVRIEAQDRTTGVVPPNEHPVQLDETNLRAMLGSLQVQFQRNTGLIAGKLEERFRGDEKSVPMFSDKELDILSESLSTGLAQAGPRQDVTFVVVGVHRGMVSFSHDRAFITGRVFVQNGKFNLLIGSLHEGYSLKVDRRMYPFVLGSRQYHAPSSRKQAPPAWQPVPMAGLETPTIDGRIRHDWLILDTDPEIWKEAVALRKEAGEAAKAALQEASQVRQESTQMSAEQERLRTEMESLKKELQTIKQTPAVAPVVTQPTPPAAEDSIKTRLRRLKELRDEELITEDEYRAKRQEILDNL